MPERLLYAWTTLNVVICGLVLYFEPVRPLGSILNAAISVVVMFLIALCMVWILRRSTTIRLAIGGIYWLAQCVGLRYDDWQFRFRVGLTVNIRIIDGPALLLSINVLALASAYLYFHLAYRRHDRAIWNDLQKYDQQS